MAYVTPVNRELSDLITATIWNQDVVDNVKYLLTRNLGRVTLSSDISTTSGVSVDMTGATVTMDIVGTRALFMFDGVIGSWPNSNIASSFRLQVVVDGVAQKTYAFKGNGNAGGESTSTPQQYQIVHILDGLTPGSHTFSIRWYFTSGDGGTVKLYGATYGPAQLMVMDI